MKLFSKAHQNIKNNQEFVQQLEGFSLGWFIYAGLGSAFVATRICLMIEDDIHWKLFWGSTLVMFAILAFLKLVFQKQPNK